MKWIIRFFFTIFSLILCGSVASCSSEDEPEIPEPQKVRRTVLVYIVATNNLSGFDSNDIREMIKGANAGAIADDARWLVYHASLSAQPRLFEVCKNDTVTLKTYENGGSATIARMNSVLDDVCTFAPAEKYGLILWSHASGWIVDGLDEKVDESPYTTLSFGNDRNEKMNISSLRSVVRNRNIDYIYFDACYMGTVEVAYELRNAVDYIIASPAETPAEGMRYDLNMAPLTLGSLPSLIEAAENTFEEYNSRPQLYSRTCTMSVISTAALDELAAATKEIYKLTPLPHPGPQITNYSVNGLSVNALDFAEYVRALAINGDIEQTLIDSFNEALNKTVIYAEATDFLWGSRPIYTAGGLSTYVFNNPDDFTKKGYDTLDWSHDVASFHIHD